MSIYTVRNTGEHMYTVIQRDGSDKYIILGTVDQAQEITNALNFLEQNREPQKCAICGTIGGDMRRIDREGCPSYYECTDEDGCERRCQRYQP